MYARNKYFLQNEIVYQTRVRLFKKKKTVARVFSTSETARKDI